MSSLAQSDPSIDRSMDDIYEDDENAMKDRYLTFSMGNETYGMEIQYVTEIVGIQKITQVPDMPDFVRGVINLRGQVIPVIDIRSRFRMEARAYDDRTCVIVVSFDEKEIGIIVDMVNEVLDIPAENISPPPSIGVGGQSRYINGMGRTNEEVKILLDVRKLLSDDELNQL